MVENVHYRFIGIESYIKDTGMIERVAQSSSEGFAFYRPTLPGNG